ncbi:MAG: cytochrome c biogenesis protein CcsA [Planctomycetes bacterium]|nr:cytochrome c biogenesis protein CcsA [Planctomycetota bacterium]
MVKKARNRAKGEVVALVGASLLLTAGLVAACFVAPTEKTMGGVQRIMYLHVAVAWFALMAFAGTAAGGATYLVRRNLIWDAWAQAAAELGWVCCSLMLLTGSLWARKAWGTWWTWDPRLTAAFVLWGIYSGYLIVRSSVEEPHQRARISAVLAIVGVVDIPLVILATRWFRGIHPAAPQMEPSMRAVLLLCVAGLSAFLSLLVWQRQRQLDHERLVGLLRARVQDRVF